MLKITLRTGPLLLAASLLRAGTCVPDTLANYELLTTDCTVNGLSFSGFTFSATPTGTATAVAASGINVSPLTINGENGLLFSSPSGFSVSPGGALTYVITYVEDPDGDIRSMDDVLDDPVTLPGVGPSRCRSCAKRFYERKLVEQH